MVYYLFVFSFSLFLPIENTLQLADVAINQ